MGEIEQRWIVRKSIARRAIKSKIFYSEEAAMEWAQERKGIRWIVVEAYFERYGVASMRRVIYRWINPYYYDSIKETYE